MYAGAMHFGVTFYVELDYRRGVQMIARYTRIGWLH